MVNQYDQSWKSIVFSHISTTNQYDLPITILRETIFLVSLQQNNDIIMAQEIIGREPEIKEIEALYQTNKPVFAVVYGRKKSRQERLT